MRLCYIVRVFGGLLHAYVFEGLCAPLSLFEGGEVGRMDVGMLLCMISIGILRILMRVLEGCDVRGDAYLEGRCLGVTWKETVSNMLHIRATENLRWYG
jgi:hypothetical protein